MENLKNIQPVEDFNWDAFEQGETYTEVSKDDLVKTYDETLNTVKDKEVVMGTVTSMNKREVVVNIGFKSDGVVPMSEFRYNPDLKIGDEVEVYIESQEDKKGQLILSHKKARARNLLTAFCALVPTANKIHTIPIKVLTLDFLKNPLLIDLSLTIRKLTK